LKNHLEKREFITERGRYILGHILCKIWVTIIIHYSS